MCSYWTGDEPGWTDVKGELPHTCEDSPASYSPDHPELTLTDAKLASIGILPGRGNGRD